jgi:hypothetical protein
MMNRQYLRSLFDALPIPAFVVDSDVHILHYNTSASALLGADPKHALRMRGGDALNCIHAEAKGCGHNDQCKHCVIRNSVQQAVAGGATQRQTHRAELRANGKTVAIDLLISATPLPDLDPPEVLLILEDITELTALRGLLPICAQCKKIRDDRQYWHNLEDYLRAHMNVKLTHGLCPTCFNEQMKAIMASHPAKTAPPTGSKPEGEFAA